MPDRELPTVLIVDDDRVNRTLLAELLRHDYRVLLAKDGPTALEFAQQEADEISLILLDVSMPELSGHQVLVELKADPRTAGIAVVFITAQDHEEDEELGLKLGATDYVTKPVRPAIVKARVRNMVTAALQRRELERLAQVDGLTGIANRRHFDQAFDRVCRHAVRANGNVTLALVDIDHFKLFNDHYGHIQGDHALRQVAQALRGHSRRPYDLAARYGGEEFVFLAGGDVGAKELMESFRDEVLALNIEHAFSPTHSRLTISCGVATAQLIHPDDGHLLLQQADALLYQAKQSGRNRVVFSGLPAGGV